MPLTVPFFFDATISLLLLGGGGHFGVISAIGIGAFLLWCTSFSSFLGGNHIGVISAIGIGTFLLRCTDLFSSFLGGNHNIYIGMKH